MLQYDPWRSRRAAVEAPEARRRRMGGVRRRDDRVRAPRRRRRPAALLSPPHGHGRPIGGRHRRLHGRDRGAGASAARHRPCDLGRLGPRRPRPSLSRAHRPRSLQGRARRQDGRGESRRLELPRFHSRPRRRARRLYRAGRRHGRFRQRVWRTQGLFRLGGARGRAGSEESARPPLREEGRGALARGAARERAGIGRPPRSNS